MGDKSFEKKLKLIRKSCGNNPQEAHKICREVILQGKADKDPKAIAYGEYFLGESFFSLGHIENVVPHTLKALTYFKRVHNGGMMMRCYNLMGISSYHFGESQMALQYYLNALDIIHEEKIRTGSMTIENNIGVIYSGLGDHEQAIRYFKNNEKKLLRRKKLDEESLYYAMNNLSDSYCELGRYQEALEYLDRIEELKLSEIGYLAELNVMLIRTKVYYKMGRTKDANQLLDEVIRRAENGFDCYSLHRDYITLCKILFEIGEMDRAGRIIDILFKSAATIDTLSVWMDVTELGIQYWEITGNIEKLREEYPKYFKLSLRYKEENKQQQLKQIKNQIRMNEMLEKYQYNADKL